VVQATSGKRAVRSDPVVVRPDQVTGPVRLLLR